MKSKEINSGVPIYLYQLRDKPKHGYHFDAEFESCRSILNEIQKLIDVGKGDATFNLKLAPKAIMQMPNIGRKGKPYNVFNIIVTRLSIKKPLFVETDEILFMIATVNQLYKFAEALKDYLDGKWDFNFEEIWFWPYAQWTKERKV